ncbi:hypothetical protein CXB51_011156 [Gossypium anomalum]|uniref:RNase H type-1 domain-containing protein n=1 Tax=Gossypium anomalum TaxID=47600 RepID=A0A8J6D073_9ROSI|nr:hypothetical protein CXB51_011156 [Gossypium anomalum]
MVLYGMLKWLVCGFLEKLLVKDWGPLINMCTQSENVPTEHVPVKNMVMLSGEWNWSAISLVLPSQVLLSISAYKPPLAQDVDDFIGWRHEKRSAFFVHSAYSTNYRIEMARKGSIWHNPGPQKVNTNSAVCNGFGNALVGGLIRGKHERWIAGFSKNIGCCSIITAKLWGALEAIKNLLQLPWMVRIAHIFREGNRVADGLASMAFSRPLGRYTFMQLSNEVLHLLHDDYSGMTCSCLV